MQFEDSEMAFLTGRVVSHANASIPVLALLTSSSSAGTQAPTPIITFNEAEDVEMAASAPRATMGVAATKSASLPRSTMIGDLKLTALRTRLATLGLAAEFAGEGVLVCSGGSGDLEQTVAVRKMGKGKITVEGNAGDVYFAVRKEVYALHAIVAQP